jgi:hypothetical protein
MLKVRKCRSVSGYTMRCHFKVYVLHNAHRNNSAFSVNDLRQHLSMNWMDRVLRWVCSYLAASDVAVHAKQLLIAVIFTKRVCKDAIRIVWRHILCSWFQTFFLFWMLYAFIWVFPRRLNFICWRFGTLCLFHLHREIGVEWLGCEMLVCSWGKFLAHAIFEPNLLPYGHTNTSQPSYFTPTCLWRWNRQCSETSAYKIQRSGNYPEESIKYFRLIAPVFR